MENGFNIKNMLQWAFDARHALLHHVCIQYSIHLLLSLVSADSGRLLIMTFLLGSLGTICITTPDNADHGLPMNVAQSSTRPVAYLGIWTRSCQD